MRTRIVRYNFKETIEAVLEYCEERFGREVEVFLWFDALVLNQSDLTMSRNSAWYV